MSAKLEKQKNSFFGQSIKTIINASFEMDDQAIYMAIHDNPAVKKFIEIEREDVDTNLSGGDFTFKST